ncbi:Dual specificity protein phosphatase 19 [Pelomyxa schiedti]|nr:Dual specificity protein phosphatase 19 [Pelomyxa schiedti]
MWSDPPVSVILEGKLLLGCVDDANSTQILSRYKVTHVLSVMADPPIRRIPNIVYMVVPVLDSLFGAPTLRKKFPECNEFIDEAVTRLDGCVLVHCAAGISRSPTVVIAYFIGKLLYSFHDAMAFVQRCRPEIEPNPAFLAILKDYNSLMLDDRRQNVEQFTSHYYKCLKCASTLTTVETIFGIHLKAVCPACTFTVISGAPAALLPLTDSTLSTSTATSAESKPDLFDIVSTLVPPGTNKHNNSRGDIDSDADDEYDSLVEQSAALVTHINNASTTSSTTTTTNGDSISSTEGEGEADWSTDTSPDAVAQRRTEFESEALSRMKFFL